MVFCSLIVNSEKKKKKKYDFLPCFLFCNPDIRDVSEFCPFPSQSKAAAGEESNCTHSVVRAFFAKENYPFRATLHFLWGVRGTDTIES